METILNFIFNPFASNVGGSLNFFAIFVWLGIAVIALYYAWESSKNVD